MGQQSQGLLSIQLRQGKQCVLFMLICLVILLPGLYFNGAKKPYINHILENKQEPDKDKQQQIKDIRQLATQYNNNDTIILSNNNQEWHNQVFITEYVSQLQDNCVVYEKNYTSQTVQWQIYLENKVHQTINTIFRIKPIEQIKIVWILRINENVKNHQKQHIQNWIKYCRQNQNTIKLIIIDNNKQLLKNTLKKNNNLLSIEHLLQMKKQNRQTERIVQEQKLKKLQKKKADDAAVKKKADEEKKKADEEKKKADEEKKKADEAAVKKKADEVKKKADEAAVKKKADEAAVKKKADEAAVKKKTLKDNFKNVNGVNNSKVSQYSQTATSSKKKTLKDNPKNVNGVNNSKVSQYSQTATSSNKSKKIKKSTK